jgi:hypothetical protein
LRGSFVLNSGYFYACLQICEDYLAKCHVTSRHVTSRHVMSCHVMSCLTVRLNNSAPTGQIFIKFDTGSNFPTSEKKIQDSYKSDKITGTSHEHRCTYFPSLVTQFPTELEIFPTTVSNKMFNQLYNL